MRKIKVVAKKGPNNAIGVQEFNIGYRIKDSIVFGNLDKLFEGEA